jgi:phospholipid transport system substrate-binding protein
MRNRYGSWVAVLMLWGGTAVAGEALDQIRGTTDRILAVMQDPSLKGEAQAGERDRRVRALIDERFDWGAMARSAMGMHWKQLSETQRRAFCELFSELVKKSYLAEVEDYAGEKIRYKGETVEGAYGVVHVVIANLRGIDVPVSYRVLRKEGGWFVYDFNIEGVSMVNNYRSQIGAILERGTFDTLMARLRERVGRGAAAPAAAGESGSAPVKTEEKP